MLKEQIKNAIISEMAGILTDIQIAILRQCLDRVMDSVCINARNLGAKAECSKSNDQLLEEFRADKRLEGLSEKSLEQYMAHTKKFLLSVNKHCVDVESNDISCYLSYVMDRGNSNTTVNNNRKFIKPFFNWLYENEYIKKDIFMKIKPIKYEDKQKEYLNDHEITKLRDVSKYNTRTQALIDFLLATGLRVSECANVRLKDVNLETGTVNVYATKTKEWRKVYLDAAASKHIKDYLDERNDSCEYLFANVKRNSSGNIERMSSESIQRIVKSCCDKADIQKESCTVHLFRKTLATRLKRSGVELPIISKLLGHKTTSTTEKYYLSLLDEDVRYAYMRSA